jgi:hypothetical protein
MRRTLATLRRAAADPAMRRLLTASFAWSAGDAAYLVGLLVWAYAVAGPGAVALVAIVRTVPSIVLAPTMAALAADRPVDRNLRSTLVVRVISVAMLGGLLLVDGPVLAVLILVAIDGIAATFLRPLRGAALPAVARTPDELIAGNVGLTTGDSLAGMAGPLLAGLVLTVAGPAATFVPGLALLALSLVSVVGLRAGSPPARRPGRAAKADGPGRDQDRLATLRWLIAHPAGPIVATFTVQRLGRGALTVLVVAAAVDLLGLGDAGVGLLTAAVGFGGLVGSAAGVALVGRDRLAPAFLMGLLVWGLGIGVVGLVPVAGLALLALVVGGVGRVLIDVAGTTLLQRTVPNAMRTPVLGIQEGLVTAALAVGSIGASVVIDLAGVAVACIATGLVVGLAAVVFGPAIRRADAAAVVPVHESTLLRHVPMFEPLPMTTIEDLASGLGWWSVEPGQVIVEQGETGHCFYVVDQGEVLVQVPGQPDRRLGPGDGFGEIALLRDVPRTATVTAVGDVRLAGIDRDRFLAAISADRRSSVTADEVVAEHLGRSAGHADDRGQPLGT